MYICESAFSIMKQTKSSTRNRMADETLDASLRLSTTEIKADIDIRLMLKAYFCFNKNFLSIYRVYYNFVRHLKRLAARKLKKLRTTALTPASRKTLLY